MAIDAVPRVRANATSMIGPPSGARRLPADRPYRRTSGKRNVSVSARPFRNWTVKSASSRALRIPDKVGGWTGGALVWLLISVAKLAPGQSDEDIIERDLTMGHLAHAGVILVLLDETSRRIDREKLAMIDNRDPMTDGLGVFDGVLGRVCGLVVFG